MVSVREKGIGAPKPTTPPSPSPRQARFFPITTPPPILSFLCSCLHSEFYEGRGYTYRLFFPFLLGLSHFNPTLTPTGIDAVVKGDVIMVPHPGVVFQLHLPLNPSLLLDTLLHAAFLLRVLPLWSFLLSCFHGLLILRWTLPTLIHSSSNNRAPSKGQAQSSKLRPIRAIWSPTLSVGHLVPPWSGCRLFSMPAPAEAQSHPILLAQPLLLLDPPLWRGGGTANAAEAAAQPWPLPPPPFPHSPMGDQPPRRCPLPRSPLHTRFTARGHGLKFSQSDPQNT